MSRINYPQCTPGKFAQTRSRGILHGKVQKHERGEEKKKNFFERSENTSVSSVGKSYEAGDIFYSLTLDPILEQDQEQVRTLGEQTNDRTGAEPGLNPK